MNPEWIEEYRMNNGNVLLAVLDYLGDDDFYAMYDVILDVLHPDSPTYGVDSMCIDGSFIKDGLLVRMSSESAFDQCCFLYDSKKVSPEEEEKIKGWINDVVAEL
ncbi:MAG: histidine kinase, partial [Oscillospiraceae bacterium]|nr:histidine kinase [Oscillospiraceae bacterium]